MFIDVIVICLKALPNSEELLFSISHTKKKKKKKKKACSTARQDSRRDFYFNTGLC